VARNGPNFEQKILAKEKDNPKFGFLRPGNPYYAYYQQKIRDIRRAEGLADFTDQNSLIKQAEEKLKLKRQLLGEEEDEASAGKKKKDKKKEKQNVPLEPPPKEEWTIEPPTLTPLEVDIIKLSAQYVARNGRQFAMGLLNREIKNPQFAFLQPNHYLHTYFNKLVESYTKVILPPRDMIDKLEMSIADKQTTLDRVMKKVHWERAQLKSEEDMLAEEEKERSLMAAIDWHDFTLVATIDYEDEPTPAAGASTAADDEMDVEMDTEMEVDKPAEPKEIKIKPNYQRTSAAAQRSTQFQVCPRCGQEIPLDEMAEHMKIELSRAGERKPVAPAGPNKEAFLPEGDDMARYLNNIAKRRSDIFGGDDDEDMDEVDERNKNKVTWDGHTSSIQGTTMAALSQIKAPPPKPTEAPRATVGPQMGTGVIAQPPRPAQTISMPPQSVPQSAPLTMPPMMYQPPMGGGYAPMGSNPYMMPPNMGGAPMGMAPQHPRPDAEDESPFKRQRNDEEGASTAAESKLMAEDEWLMNHPAPVTVKILVPRNPEKAEWFMNGQTIDLTVSPSETVRALKDKLQEKLGGMPANKQKLRAKDLGFLKDEKSMAYYNFTSGVELELGVKERGGRKK
jgi:splicing factor 3A subunit 1